MAEDVESASRDHNDDVLTTIDLTALEPNDHEELLNANLGQSNLVVSEASDFLVTHECSYQDELVAEPIVKEESDNPGYFAAIDDSNSLLFGGDSISNPSMSISMASMTESRDEYERHSRMQSLQMGIQRGDPVIYVDEETQMYCHPSPGINSPRDIISPTDPGEVSSPFSAMESDGMETGFDEANLSAPGGIGQRPQGFFGASTPLECTTTPGGSSSGGDDDYEEPSGSRTKRRRTKREYHPHYMPSRSNFHSLAYSASSSQIPSPSSEAACANDLDSSTFSPPVSLLGNANFTFGINVNERRCSGDSNRSFPTVFTNAAVSHTSSQSKISREDHSSDHAKRTKTAHVSNGDEKPRTNANTSAGTQKRRVHHRAAASSSSCEEPILHRQHPSKIAEYELQIIAQPETQHRARYLTEGSRGPVKDVSQQGYPQIQLLGYVGQPVLQVYVGTDSGKIKPHAFYQACRVTGRNTSACEERVIEGTNVIEIPIKNEDMTVSVDCVGILKLRNSDVEARIGVRNQKRNQSIRLVFRVVLNNVTEPSKNQLVILQVASVRINCTQPLGQPEITKKSLDRCPADGNTEVFIIGKNFHRGTKVIFQDPEEADGSQWSAEGEVDKETFHQSHMVVCVPSYHNLSIVKPVNVQILVEYQGKRCEPHSFTYVPMTKQLPAKVECETPIKSEVSIDDIGPSACIQTKPPAEVANLPCSTPDDSNQDSKFEHSVKAMAMQSLLDGPIDKKFLVALFSKLVTSVEKNSSTETQSTTLQELRSDVDAMSQGPQGPDHFPTIQMEESNQVLHPTSVTFSASPFPSVIPQIPQNIACQTNVQLNATNSVLPSASTVFQNPVFPNPPMTTVSYSSSNPALEHSIYDSKTVPVQISVPRNTMQNSSVKSEFEMLQGNVWTNEHGQSMFPKTSLATETMTTSSQPPQASQINPQHQQLVSPNMQQFSVGTMSVLGTGQAVNQNAFISNSSTAHNNANVLPFDQLPQSSVGVNSFSLQSSAGVNSFSSQSSVGVNSFSSQSSVGVNSFSPQISVGVNSFSALQGLNVVQCSDTSPLQGNGLALTNTDSQQILQMPALNSTAELQSSSINQLHMINTNPVFSTQFGTGMQNNNFTNVNTVSPTESTEMMSKVTETSDVSKNIMGLEHSLNLTGRLQGLQQQQPKQQQQSLPGMMHILQQQEPMVITSSMNHIQNSQPYILPCNNLLNESKFNGQPAEQKATVQSMEMDSTKMTADIVHHFQGKHNLLPPILETPQLQQLSMNMNKFQENVQTITEQQTATVSNNRAIGHAADLFAMDQLLQSIDGSENLATISGEDVQQQLQ